MGMPHEPGGSLPRAVVLFDGFCHLCQGSVRFIADRDPHAYFRFAPLHSDVGRALLARSGSSQDGPGTLVLIEAGRAYTRSTAALRIARRLRGGWRLLHVLRIVPRPLRDAAYDFVAAHRYRWFGRSAACEIPSGRVRSRLLTDAGERAIAPGRDSPG